VRHGLYGEVKRNHAGQEAYIYYPAYRGSQRGQEHPIRRRRSSSRSQQGDLENCCIPWQGPAIGDRLAWFERGQDQRQAVFEAALQGSGGATTAPGGTPAAACTLKQIVDGEDEVRGEGDPEGAASSNSETDREQLPQQRPVKTGRVENAVASPAQAGAAHTGKPGVQADGAPTAWAPGVPLDHGTRS